VTRTVIRVRFLGLFVSLAAVLLMVASGPAQAQTAGNVITKWSCLTSSLAVGPFAHRAFEIPGCQVSTSTVWPPLTRLGRAALPINPSGAPSGLTAQVIGQTVVLTWTPPSSGGTPTSYVLQAGSASGLANVANANTGSALPTLTATEVPSGRYVFGVRAQNAGGTSTLSNEIAVRVGVAAACATTPGPPIALTQSVNGSGVTLNWQAPAGCSPSSYVIQAGSAPGLNNLADFSTGNAATTFSTSGVPTGIYYVRVLAVGPGGTGSASNEVVVAVNTCAGPPGAVTGLAATVFGATVSLTWVVPSGSPTGYFILAGSAPGRIDLGVIGTGGEYFIAGGVPAGTYYVRVLARNSCGNGLESNEVVVSVGQSAPVPTTSVIPLHGFAGSPSDGSNLSTLVLARDGNFYGTTVTGGPFNSSCATNLNGCGTVFKMTLSGALTVLHSFGADGTAPYPIYPYSPMIQGSDGNFYGTLTEGTPAPGRLWGGAAVFKMTPAGGTTIIATLGGPSWAALLEAPDGYFYGTTAYGSTGAVDPGGFTGNGTVFKMSPSGALTYLHAFSGGSDGKNPYGGLVRASDGNFYGTAATGGASNAGTVFKITAAGTLTTLHAFTGADGANPLAALTLASDGNFYGTAQFGGGAANAGTAFKITPAGAFTVLHTFTGVFTSDGTPPSRAASDGYQPVAGLLQASDGNFYGTTAGGGPHGGGTAFRMASDGTYTQIYAFAGNAEGGSPTAALVQGPDGALYGTSQYGGTYNKGAIFKMIVR
jgi:uncharacterized repeat protein (TIGR03803 family)